MERRRGQLIRSSPPGFCQAVQVADQSAACSAKIPDSNQMLISESAGAVTPCLPAPVNVTKNVDRAWNQWNLSAFPAFIALGSWYWSASAGGCHGRAISAGISADIFG